ncbi:hypothetical protein LTS18_006740 [Coniosporium uncinatum]|uniref:Uncharacterized protein n=1 Tax=Coniosporium uncinatum TaxID=93489 RepID=A0ACC3DCC1_9PEZI|nr:hypothetical protein LTS18_006740 [Coniosporium uncinatum]
MGFSSGLIIGGFTLTASVLYLSATYHRQQGHSASETSTSSACTTSATNGNGARPSSSPPASSPAPSAAYSHTPSPKWTESADNNPTDSSSKAYSQSSATMNLLDKASAKRVFDDWKIYYGTLIYMGVVCTSYAGNFFIPTILREMGYTAETAQSVALTCLSNLMSGHHKRAIAPAIQVGFGNCGGLIASNIFFTTESPLYKDGYGTALGLLWMCAISCTVLYVGVRRENAKRDRGERAYRLQLMDADDLGDDHPSWRYAT